MSSPLSRSALRLARFSRFQAGRGGLRRFATTVTTDQVHIVEVGPRDGLQNEKNTISLETKTSLIEKLADTGLRTIEAGSFVSPKWVPQMANSAEILSYLLTTPPRASSDAINYHFLVPNMKGLENFFDTYRKHAKLPALGPSLNAHDPIPTPGSNSESQGGVTVSIFTAATETFSRKNTNCSIAESLERFKPVFSEAKKQNIAVRAYISVALGCPYEGPDVDPKRVADLAVDLLELGAEEISIGDTTGMGNARSTKALLETLRGAGIEMQDIALHLHDTYGQALVNSVVGLEAGVRTFDSSVAGLGGCPYSPGATGNVSTEEMVYLMESLGLSTGVELGKLSETGDWISGELGRANDSRVGKAILAKRRKREDEKKRRDGPL